MIHCVEWLKVNYIISYVLNFQKSIKSKYDEYGDPYYNLSTVEDLKHIFSTMGNINI